MIARVVLSGCVLLAVLGSGAAWGQQLVNQCAWTGDPVTAPTSNQAMMTPAVADLNTDGFSEVIFISFVNGLDINGDEDGILRIISGINCATIASVVSVGTVTCADGVTLNLNQRGGPGILAPSSGVAVGDLDRDGKPEIVAVLEGPTINQHERIIAFDWLGGFLWCSAPVSPPFARMTAPALANLDAHTGIPFLDAFLDPVEVIVASKVWNGAGSQKGLVRFDGPNTRTSHATLVANLDGASLPELVTGTRAYKSGGPLGTIFWNAPTLLWNRPDLTDGTTGSFPLYAFPAVADFDLDGLPEVVITDTARGRVLLLNGQTGATRCVTPLPAVTAPCAGPVFWQGGPPFLGDIDNQPGCIPEVGVGGANRFGLFRFISGNPTTTCLALIWSAPTQDCSSRMTGGTLLQRWVFYADETTLRAFRAFNGAPEPGLTLANTSGTAMESPAIADTDNDGHAEIVITANDYATATAQRGVRILRFNPESPAGLFGDARRTWNQHTYHHTNAHDPFVRIPIAEIASWQPANTNSYRVQSFPAMCGYTPDF